MLTTGPGAKYILIGNAAQEYGRMGLRHVHFLMYYKVFLRISSQAIVMVLEISRSKDTFIIAIPGRFDANNATDIESEIKTLLAGKPEKIVLDFSATDYIASAGLRVLLVITRDQMKAGGRVVLAGIRPQVFKVFDMAGFTSIFTICATKDEAIRKIS
jgi:anti-anti-sigma factor